MREWSEANHQCYIHGGSSLVIIEDSAMFDFLKTTMSQGNMWVYTAARRDELVILIFPKYNSYICLRNPCQV